MSVILELPPELEAALTTEATQFGLALPEYILQVLAEGRAKAPRTGAELLAYWKSENLVGTRSETDDVPTHARLLREQAQQRTRG